MRKHISAIARSARGSTALEYAIIAPILLMLLLGIIEYNLVMYASSVLEGALVAAAREGKTSYVNVNSTGTCPSPVVNGVIVPQSQATYINCLVGVRVSGILDPTKLQVTYNDTGSSTFSASGDAPTFSSGPCTDNPALANPPTYPLCSENSQNAGDIVIYTVTYPWAILTPYMQKFIGTNGIFTLTASAIVKNEPYGVTR